jgi:hypothetical protein
MMRPTHELALPMMDSEVLGVADINEAIIAAPAVRVDDCFESHATANNGLQRGLFAVGNDLRIDRTITLEDTEDDGLARCAAPALATHSTSAKVRFIDFNFTRRERRCAFTLCGDALTKLEKDRGRAPAREASQMSRITGCQIQCEVAQELTKFALANLRLFNYARS